MIKPNFVQLRVPVGLAVGPREILLVLDRDVADAFIFHTHC